MEQKFCVNCVHFFVDPVVPHRPDLAYCIRERKISLVTGELELLEKCSFCNTERQSKNPMLCGEQGQYYQGANNV